MLWSWTDSPSAAPSDVNGGARTEKTCKPREGEQNPCKSMLYIGENFMEMRRELYGNAFVIIGTLIAATRTGLAAETYTIH